MKKILLLAASVLFLGQTFATTSVELPKAKLKATEIFIPVGSTGKKISLMELSTISLSSLQELKGEKMNFFERMAFKTAQKKLRKGISPDGTIVKKKLEKFFSSRGGETGFHFGGFALGFFVGLIGVLIAYLIKDDFKSNRVKWAWLGFGVAVVINLILILAVLNNVN